MSLLAPDAFLTHFLGHRALTRRTIAAFPVDQFETFSVGGMRPFGVLVREMLAMSAPMFVGFATDDWQYDSDRTPISHSAALEQWDAGTALIKAHWPAIVERGFDREITLFGQWPGNVAGHFQYLLENEIHHRGQVYVYLRALGVEPPPFWERG
jgi:uncharacterized damage-inducible protein DinB